MQKTECQMEDVHNNFRREGDYVNQVFGLKEMCEHSQIQEKFGEGT